MGKHMHSEGSGPSSGIKVDPNHPGCMWSILHVLKYHRWRYVRKGLPYKRMRNGKPDDESNPSNAFKGQKQKEAAKGKVVEENQKQSSGAKHSVKARLKALVTEDKHNKKKKKKKGKHRRIASDTQLERTDPINVEPVDEDPLAGIIFTGGSNDVEDNGPNELQKQQNRNQSVEEKLDMAKRTLVEQEMTYEDIEEELTTDDTECQSKQSLEALNLINLNKESLLKLLHNQSFPLVHHIHSNPALRKFESFPSPGPPSKEDFWRKSLPHMDEIKRDGILKRNQSVTEHAEHSAPVAVLLKNSSESSAASSRFKGLKKKIKHVLEESRNEKQRITMDAVLHKVPPGNKFSKNLKKEISDHLKNPVLSKDGGYRLSDTNRGRNMRRTSSHYESMDRYCQLYESTNKEATHHGPEKETPKLRTGETDPPKTSQKHLVRILSLPDLQYYAYNNDGSCETSAAPIRTAVDSSESAKFRSDEGKGVEIDETVESKIQENLDEDKKVSSPTEDQNGSASAASSDRNVETGLHIDDLGNLTAADSAYHQEQDNESTGRPSSELEDSSSFSTPGSGFEEDTTWSQEDAIHSPPSKMDSLANRQHESNTETPKMAAKSVDIEQIQIPIRNIVDIPRILVDANNQGEFNFVRDVLELSGFSGTEALGTWHAEDQPLDPCMYEEMEGFLVLEPDCCGNEAANCNQLVLFDVINEVLMEIYERSYSYIPVPLTYVSHTRPLPVGHHVLEEVWECIRWYLSFKPLPDQTVDYVVSRDLAKNDGWMNLQFDAECVGLELESLMFDELIEEAIWE